ncbi:hypothetical protein [Ferruginibacter sp. SUN106]|uniref:hypothetical protein n=1 Tax=Ferruginibacter sp. SUN106 TaxID=2978348 RepID=UPI003D361FFE
MKVFSTSIAIFLLSFTCFKVSGQRSAVYELEERLMIGDKKALFEIAPYFDDHKKVVDFLGYHRLETTPSEIAKRMIEENCLFTAGEIIITEKTSAKDFLNFLNKNKEKIIFSNLAKAFLLTPLENRPVKFEIREISKNKKETLLNKAAELKNSEWVTENQIDSLIEAKDPKSLLLIASELYKVRYRFNRSYFKEYEFTELLALLTGTDIGVENEENRISWHIDKEFYPDAALHLLSYFAKNYTQYKWDEQLSLFVAPNYKIKTLWREAILFEFLVNKNDSIAMDAFTQLTTCDPERVTELAVEYNKGSDFEKNDTIPIFPYNFLKQIVLLTDYCRKEHIDFTGSPELRNDIKKLDSGLSFNERRQLENKLISNLSLDDITALEYWALINEQSDGITYSTGRVLDMFYSKNWSTILHTERQLTLYLKKSLLFDRLGIIGICNNYLKKFTSCGATGIDALNKLQSNDSDMNQQIVKAKAFCMLKLKRPADLKKINDGNKDFIITGLKEKIHAIDINTKDSAKRDDALVSILSKITYNQIGIAMKAIENITFQTSWYKYSFMERDFGFFMVDNFDIPETRNEFMELYNKFSEYELYAYYLQQADIDYQNEALELDYDKIYELLKYDVVIAFVGGGGGSRDREVYSLIKLLEIKYKTTLGYPHKLCNSDGMYGCDSQDRANEWMQFLIDNKLLKKVHDEPISFHYEP